MPLDTSTHEAPCYSRGTKNKTSLSNEDAWLRISCTLLSRRRGETKDRRIEVDAPAALCLPKRTRKEKTDIVFLVTYTSLFLTHSLTLVIYLSIFLSLFLSHIHTATSTLLTITTDLQQAIKGEITQAIHYFGYSYQSTSRQRITVIVHVRG